MSTALFEKTALVSYDHWQRIQDFYEAYLEGRELDTRQLWPGVLPLYQISQDTATINIQGFLTRVVDPFLKSIGSTSYQEIKQCLMRAATQEGIKKIILNFDSHGGTVHGASGLAHLIYQLRNVIPVYAITDGIMSSAAYWLACGASKILISCETAEVGGIGVLAQRKKLEDPDIVTAAHGKHKLKQTEARIKERTEHLFEAFTSDVSRFRGIPVSDIKAMQGLTYIGKNSITAGLVDGYYDILQYELCREIKMKEIPK
jgi:ClpP class serine protease